MILSYENMKKYERYIESNNSIWKRNVILLKSCTYFDRNENNILNKIFSFVTILKSIFLG